MLKNIKAVIFDLDGTLMDSMWMWKDIDVEYLGRYGFSVPKELDREIEGMGFTETAEYFKKHFDLPCTVQEIKQDWLDMAYDKYANEVELKPGAYSFLQEIRGRGLRVGIASSNTRELILACLRSHHIEDYFDCITTSCDVKRGKPAPDVYLSVADVLEVSPSDCLVFEDVPMGILAGRNAGMRVCAVEDDFSRKQRDEIRRLADYYITSYDEIQKKTYEVLS